MWLLLIPVAFLILKFGSLGSAASKLLYTAMGYKVKGGNFIVKLQITNPSNQDFFINYIFLDLIGSGKALGQVRQENLQDLYKIPANLTKTHEIIVKPLVVDLLRTFLEMILTGQKPPILSLEGYLKINDIRIPLKTSLAYTTI